MHSKIFYRNNKSGFTLIELLVVISIIGVLSAVVLASLSTARAKARDAKAIGEFKQLQTALALYFDKYRTYPPIHPLYTGAPPYGDAANFDYMAQALVTEGFLSSLPVAPANHTYMYYRYSGDIGGLIVTSLEAAAPSFGYPGTCRPFSGSNWCRSDVSSTQYCVCNPF